MNKHQILYDKVLNYAKNNDNVRVVVLNGSRVNSSVSPDDYQDFDMVYYVMDFDKQINDHRWVGVFGKPLVKQYKGDQRNVDFDEPYYNYMMQFKDGSRLDLTVMRLEDCIESIQADSLTKVLLDKDNICPNIKPDDSSYHIQKPSQKEFNYCVNEFFWVIPYVAKGLARNHLTYALKHLSIIRVELEHIIDYWIGLKCGYDLSVGKGKSNYPKLLRPEIYSRYKKTYSDYDKTNIIKALFDSLYLFDELAREISTKHHFYYQENLLDQMIDFLKENYNIKETL